MLTNYYSYLVEHDLGLAPNPFGGYCTLSVCKPQIRKSRKLKVGDWIIGTGSKALGIRFSRKFENRLIYAMRVSEMLSFDDYWKDTRFKCKRPILNGSLPLMYGDNFYHKDEEGNWKQEDSAHSNNDGSPNLEHLKIDISGERAIVSNHFFYFGQSAPLLPQRLKSICHSGIGQKLLKNELGNDFVSWLTKEFTIGIHGKPINWIAYNQQRLFSE